MKGKYIYICSAARSGSTLLDMLLGGHSSGASLGEFSFLGKAISLQQSCGCGSQITECDAWDKVLSKIILEKGINLREKPYALRQWDTKASVVIDPLQQTKGYLFLSKLRAILAKLHFSGCPNALKPGMPNSLKKGAENTEYLYELILKEWDKSFIIDSSKNYLKAIQIYKNSPTKTKVILLTRDGRGVFFSRFNTGFTKKESFQGWYRYYRSALYFLSKHIEKKDLLIVKYEDLMGDLEGELKRICAWAQIDYESEMCELSSGERHLVNGNNTMFKRDKPIKLDERWKTELQINDLEWFMKRAGDLNLMLGYRN